MQYCYPSPSGKMILTVPLPATSPTPAPGRPMMARRLILHGGAFDGDVFHVDDIHPAKRQIAELVLEEVEKWGSAISYEIALPADHFNHVYEVVSVEDEAIVLSFVRSALKSPGSL
jgi:hypothetical protein